MAVQEKEDREKDLREMAAKARVERAGVFQPPPTPVQGKILSYFDIDSFCCRFRGASARETTIYRG
jgi:hypothetical protein